MPKDSKSVSKRAGQLPPIPRRWLVVLVVVPLILAVAIGVVVWQLSGNYSDDTLKWTVVAAVFTGGAAAVGLIGLPFAIWQLAMVQVEQARIADQLAAHPEVDMGFAVAGDRLDLQSEMTVVAEAWPSPLGPGWATVDRLYAVNVGQRTARNPRWTITFPPGVHGITTAENTLGVEDGSTVIRAEEAVLNPQARRQLFCRINLEENSPTEVEFVCRCTSEDAPEITKALSVRIVKELDAA